MRHCRATARFDPQFSGFAYGPKYSGSSEKMAFAFPVVEYADRSGFFASTVRGIGQQAQFGDTGLSAALAYGAGRRDDNSSWAQGSSRLKGMGNVAGSALLDLAVRQTIGQALTVSFVAHTALTNRERGNAYELALSAPLYAGQRDQLGIFTSARAGDGKYMQTFYGVTANQQQRSGFAQYSPSAGLEGYGAGIKWSHRFTPNWSMQSMVAVSHLAKKAVASPLTERMNQPHVFTGAVYSFN